MALNRELVERKITLILQELENIRPLASMTVEAYRGDPRNEALAERYLERLIGRAIDISYHVVTESLLISPKDYAESFLLMEKAGVLSAEEARLFAGLPGLKNRITHEYNGIDEQLVHQALKRTLEDLPRYLTAVRAWMNRASQE
jgi:uncharacterized protein YutE (UPF0331/DUF86 family)